MASRPRKPLLAPGNEAEWARINLEELEAFHGELPIDPIPGLDS